MDTSFTSKTIEKVKDFYYNDNNKGVKMALVLIGGSLLVYAVYAYSNKSASKVRDSASTAEPYADEMATNEQQEHKAPDQMTEKERKRKEQQEAKARLKKEREIEAAKKKAAKKKKKKNQKQIDEMIEFYINEGCRLIVDGKGWNIKIFARFYWEDIKTGKEDLLKFACKSCGNICRDLVELEEEEEPAASTSDDSKTRISEIAEEEVARREKGDDEKSWQNLMNVGETKPLDWKFHDNSGTKEALFVISEDGLTATSNKRSGTVLFGPFIRSSYYAGGGKRARDYAYFGNVFTVELKIAEAEGCGVGFCTRNFGQWIGKNEAQVNSMMLNQTGWFYTSSVFKHEWQHARECPMGKWFKADDTIVVVVDCTDTDNLKAQIYNKENAENKFEIEKLPQEIAIAVNIIVGSNPTGTVQPAVTVTSATMQRRVE